MEERYNYLYSGSELESFIPELNTMDKAAKNVIRLKELLGI